MGRIVETQRGRIEGVEEGSALAFRGIPYAASTAGALRWRPPQPPPAWSGVRPAGRCGPAAPQRPGATAALLGEGGGPTSEDCLSLNVWTPAADGGRRPVLVFLHGGGFVTGSGGLPFYDGAPLAARGDAVVVTLNYRLGALGFLHLPALAREEGGAPGNHGLLDQIAALEWVRENVSRFGGDPQRVTLFGQSAGAMCAATLLALPRAGGLFQRLVLQSGAARNVHAQDTAERVSATFCRELGCAPDDLRRLRATPVEEILDAQARTVERLRGELEDPVFQPCVDAALVTRPPLAALREGRAAPVPLLVGTNLDEWKFYGLADPKAAALDREGLLRRLRRGLRSSPGDPAELAARLVETYERARRGRASVAPPELWFAIQSDRWFRHPAMQLAALHAERGCETRGYLFDWPSPALGGVLGACHALELPFVFGTLAHPRLRAIIGAEAAAEPLSRRMQDAWLAFARGGDPGGAGLGDWPLYAAGERATMRLGSECGVIRAPLERERAVWDAIAPARA